jgi:molybdenum cofactor synthesis domain-containing protein
VALVALESAQEFVLEQCHPLPPASLPLADALGCVTTAAITASAAVPPFANTAMDGYAVRAADTAAAPVVLEVVGTLAAGAAPDVSVGPGQAIRIMTGAPIPPGADAVVMVEQTSPAGHDLVLVAAIAEPGDHVRPAGEDIAIGQTVFDAGTALGAGHLGVLASLGLWSVVVFGRPRVGVLSTGDELVEGPGSLQPGQIRDSNRPTLLALVAQAGCLPIDLGICRDDVDALTAAVSSAASRCDALLTSGGVSVGDFDYVKTVLDRLSGGAMRWMQVAIKPAKPFAFGTVEGVPVFGLPGNPVSSMVSFECFARPALRRMMGHSSLFRPQVVGLTDESLARRPDGKLHLVRVAASWSAADGRVHVHSSGVLPQASNLLRSMALANALALVPDGDGLAAGAEVEIVLLD